MKRARAGFTLIEILIAIAVLVIGVCGIIALFPSTIETASRVVEDTYAATIVQSVVDSLSASQRSGLVYPVLNGDERLRYMVFDHDGCLDALPTGASGPSQYSSNWQNDHIILLPRGSATTLLNAAREPILLYPVPCQGHCPAGTAADRSTGSISGTHTTPSDVKTSGNASVTLKPAYDGSLVTWVRRVFPLGRYAEGTAPSGFNTGDIRAEYLDKSASGNPVPGSFPVDPYPQYSFALAMRRAATDTSGNAKIDTTDKYADDLYEVRIMVFRNFNSDATLHQNILSGSAPVPRTNLPVREFVTLLELGPGTVPPPSLTAPPPGVTINGHAPNH